MNTPPPIHKLPKWAQDHIQTLQRQRDTAVKALKDWTDTQTVRPISVSEMPRLGRDEPHTLTRYIEGSDLTIKWMGVELSVMLRTSGNQHDSSIMLQWSALNDCTSHVAMVPTSFQSVSLIAKENMR